MEADTSTVGRYLATRLAEVGMRHFFAVPGDYNLVLLDEFLKVQELEMISCCNELNAGYAADGYARATSGVSAALVTFSVGGLSLLNAIAGAYAEDLPVIAISGGPNTNSAAENELLHHTLGKVDYGYQREIFAQVTQEAIIIQHPADAPRQIDRAIESAITHRKPVYLEIGCNIAATTVPAPTPRSFNPRRPSDPVALAAAVQHTAELLNTASKPVLIAGVKLRSAEASGAFHQLADAAGYAVASMSNAKGLVDEQHPGYMGTYWGPVGTPGCGEIVESADLCLFAGPTFTDYTTTGHTTLINPAKSIRIESDSVVLPGRVYDGISMAEFLAALAPELQHNDTSLQAFHRIREEIRSLEPGPPDAPLTTRQLFLRIQKMLDDQSTVIAETGDSWFNGIGLNLPTESRFEIQMQYGSIGWSVGATLGYCVGSPERRVIACIGDGSFQMTAQELSTMIRYHAKPIIFLINNGGYTIEVEIHDGPYNTIKNWKYAELVDVFRPDHGEAWGCRATTEGELDDAIDQALSRDGLALIEVAIDRDDCSKNLLEWGGHVAKNNSRPPRTS